MISSLHMEKVFVDISTSFHSLLLYNQCNRLGGY